MKRDRRRRTVAADDAVERRAACSDAGCRSGRYGRRRGRRACRKLERSNTCLPVAARTVGLAAVVLVRVPERAVVRRIDAHRRVIAPAITRRAAAVVRLRTRTGNELCLALRQRIQRIAREASGIRDAWKIRHRAARRAIGERHVALCVDGDAAHPAMQRRVGRVDLLLHRRRRHDLAGDVDLRPLRPDRNGRRRILDVMNDP